MKKNIILKWLTENWALLLLILLVLIFVVIANPAFWQLLK